MLKLLTKFTSGDNIVFVKVKESQTMSKISDEIENFILESMGDDNLLLLSRNELAHFFNCAPSQINYVLSTRFSPVRGFHIESQRGGGGFVKLIKITNSNFDDILQLMENLIGDEIDFNSAKQLLENLINSNLISKSEASLIESCISSKALSNPFKMENKLRAKILKNLILSISVKGGNDVM